MTISITWSSARATATTSSPGSPSAPSGLEALALAEATRSLESQESSLDGLRGRSTTIVSAGGVIFSLFTAQALGKHHLDVWIWLALSSFAMLAAAVIIVLWPRSFRFRSDVTTLIVEIDQAAGASDPSHLASVQRDWAYWATQNYNDNQGKIDCLTRCYTAGLVALSLEVIFLGLALVLH